jgi:hypothetical protein
MAGTEGKETQSKFSVNEHLQWYKSNKTGDIQCLKAFKQSAANSYKMG